MSRLVKKAEAAWVLDPEKQLPYLEVEDGSGAVTPRWRDILLNPLKDTYDYDDLARDYLGMTVPSKADLLGKLSLGKSWSVGNEKAGICLCYMGYIAWRAAPVLEEKFKTGDYVEPVLKYGDTIDL